MMKSFKNIFALILMASSALSALAVQLPAGTKSSSVIGIDVKNIVRDGSDIIVDLAIDLSKVKMPSNVETIYTPLFCNETDTVRFQPFAVTGRNRMYWDKRNNALLPLTFYKGTLVKGSTVDPSTPNRHNYTLDTVLPSGRLSGSDAHYDLSMSTRFLDWMEQAQFTIDIETRGCANCIKDVEDIEPYYALAETDFVQRSFFPEFLYVTPVAEAVKMREISARAYIDFPVNRTEIYPDYRRNPEELAKIRATIDSVRNDKDISITSLHISGTASPEGGYQNNVRLASGRTASLKDYVQGLYRFPAGLITTSYEPVDWQGLREFLQMAMGLTTSPSDSIRADQFTANEQFLSLGDASSLKEILPNAVEILGIVNSDIEPFARNLKIKQTYPEQYAWLLANVYPALRHSDYRIQFEIKHYTEVNEILEVMATRPQNLSLEEIFVAARAQEPGSELYNRAFELAVTMYPEDETANLNAATAAMQRGDLISAQRFLSKVTHETPESDYANAMLKLLQGQTDEAISLFNSLSNSLNPEVAAKASAAKEGLEEVAKANASNYHVIE